MVWTPPGFTHRPVRNRYSAARVRSHFAGTIPHTRGLVLHVQVGSGGLFSWFDNPSSQASSTWWAGKKGQREQYVDPDTQRAWAQASGNWDYHSIETEGQPGEPLTDAQVESVAQALAAGHARYGWPLELAGTPGDGGLAWHGMGAAAWGNHPDCPGDLRRAQMPAVIARAKALATSPKENPVASTTLNDWPWLSSAPAAYFVAPNGHHVSAANRDVAAVLGHLAQRLHDEVEPCQTIYGYRRSNAGVNKYVQDTNHASATAFDYNGARHLYEPSHQALYARDPYAAIGWSQAKIDQIRGIVADINRAAGKNVLRWGGDFGMPTDPSGWRVRGWRDPMHFEVNGAHMGHRFVTAADMARAAARIGAQVGSAIGDGVLKNGDRGKDVADWQRYLNSRGGVQPKIEADGVFGPATTRATKQWQGNNHLTADGVVGKKSRAKRAALKRARILRALLAHKGKIRRGDRGAAVGDLQRYLNSRSGVKPKIKVDKVFGPATERALKQWQGNNHLTRDAVWGPDCIAKAKRLH